MYLVLLQKLAKILYTANDERGFINQSRIQEILDVSPDDVLPEGVPSKRRKRSETDEGRCYLSLLISSYYLFTTAFPASFLPMLSQ